MRTRKPSGMARFLPALIFWAVVLAPGAAAAACYETGWFSEEGKASAFCRPGYAVRGLACKGRYCDNKKLTCCSYATGYDRTAKFWWSPWFSEERSGRATTRAGFVSGIACRGRYCDNLRLNYLYSSRTRNNGQCRFTPSFSEEGRASASCRNNEFVAGIRCSGNYCDNLRLQCCGTR